MARKDAITRLAKFIIERERIRLRRAAGVTKPWTTDPILQRYRFCNVHRNDDTVTQWIHNHWSQAQHVQRPYHWFAMAVARFVNWPETLARMPYPVPWSRKNFLKALREQAKHGKVFTGAYMIRASAADPGKGKAEYLADKVLGPAWKKRDTIVAGNMREFAEQLQRFHDFGSFMTGQVIADAKQYGPWRLMPDYREWAISGPGSRRGLNRVLGREIDQPWKEKDWLWWLQNVSHTVGPLIGKHDIYLDNQDLQNCLCEFDKYERVRLGQGRPRSLFPGV